MKNITIQKFADKTAKIGIVGLGYVGLPLMLRYVDIGYQVLGFDIDKTKVDKLNKGETYIEHIPAEKIAAASNSLFEATTDFSRIGEVEAVILCVPTPLNKYREPDMSFVIDTTDAVKPYLRAGQVLSLESTTYPGTTEEELLPRVEEGGLKVGKDVFLVYSPEREDPGNPNFETRTIPKVIGGHTPACLEVGIALYQPAIDKVVPVSSTKAAELTKLLENIHRAVNIGLVNEMKIVADKMDVDIHEVIAAAATKPFGFVAYYPGPGLGGHCIPIDPFYLTWKAREYGVNTRFIELAGEVNSHMPDYVISKVGLALNEHNRSIKDSKILVLGIAYKKNVDDTREAGVRSLDREIAKICRKAVIKNELSGSLKTKKAKVITVSADNLNDYLGVRRFDYGVTAGENRVGQVTGLAWTEVGGELLTIEAVALKGKGNIVRTGKLGDVMLESITAAWSVVRSRAESLGIAPDFYEKNDMHVHVPEGATPKDGPSAGIAMTLSMVSALTGIPVRADVAMTGEITLRGEVLPIGGLKEKLLAALRGGIKHVLIPKDNVKDLEEIPQNVKDGLEIHAVKWIDEVFEWGLERQPTPYIAQTQPETVPAKPKAKSGRKAQQH